MTHLRTGILLAFAAGAALITACSSSGSTPTTAKAAAKAIYVPYTAIGASDAVGYGATVPCTEASPALVADPTCPEPGADGYVPDIRTDFAHYGFTDLLQDLGISGAVIGPDIAALQETATPICPAGTSPGNFLVNELPKVNPSALFVTIFAGGNDVNAIVNGLACGLGGTTTASQTSFVTKEVTAFGEDYLELATSVHKQAPEATIVVANIPNFANVPYAFNFPADEDETLRVALAEVSDAINTDVINQFPANGIPVVDLQCNPQSYVPANFYTDGFHPNDTGYALLAGLFVQQALSNTPALPAASCAEQGLAASAGSTTYTPLPSVRRAVRVGMRLRLPLR